MIQGKNNKDIKNVALFNNHTIYIELTTNTYSKHCFLGISKSGFVEQRVVNIYIQLSSCIDALEGHLGIFKNWLFWLHWNEIFIPQMLSSVAINCSY